ncbi:MAG: hypothetical protein ACK4TA_05865 [Saprospiraceae bacterium]
MQNKPYLFLILLFATAGCSNTAFDEEQLQGLWQSLNDPHRVVSIDRYGTYTLYLKGENFSKNIAGFEQLQFQIVQTQDVRHADFNIVNPSNESVFVKGKVEMVNADRMRLYFFKHNNILDLADEYYKTDGFGNFEKIMATFDTSKW